MALPAGRYGVTKNQLLKIKKLPMNTIKLIEELTEKFDLLGSAAFKNSTSTVTDSSDLVESGAVKDIVGWGNKNLLLYPFPNNLTFPVTAGNVTYNDNNGEITVTGTHSSGANLVLASRTTPNNLKLDTGTYILSGAVPESKVILRAFCTRNGNAYIYGDDEGAGVEFEVLEGDVVGVLITQSTGFTSGTVVKPMIRKADVTDSTYEPYHESVDKTKADNSVIGTVEDGTNPTKAYAVDEFMVRDGAFCQVTAPVTTSSTWTEGSNYTKKSIAEVLQSLMS